MYRSLRQKWMIVALLLLPLFLVSCGGGGGGGDSDGAKINVAGIWFMNDPLEDTWKYLIADGNGNITDNSGFDAGSGSYVAKSSNEFDVTLVDGVTQESITAHCTIDSKTLEQKPTGTCTVDGVSTVFPIEKASVSGAECQGTWDATFTDNTGSRPGQVINFTFSVDATGAVTSIGGDLTGPVSGHVFCVYLGHPTRAVSMIRTGEADEYNQIRLSSNDNGVDVIAGYIFGPYEINSGNGQIGTMEATRTSP